MGHASQPPTRRPWAPGSTAKVIVLARRALDQLAFIDGVAVDARGNLLDPSAAAARIDDAIAQLRAASSLLRPPPRAAEAEVIEPIGRRARESDG